MLGTISSTLSLIHPNRLLDHLGVGVLLTSQRQEVQAGGGDALVAELARDLADLPYCSIVQAKVWRSRWTFDVLRCLAQISAIAWAEIGPPPW